MNRKQKRSLIEIIVTAGLLILCIVLEKLVLKTTDGFSWQALCLFLVPYFICPDSDFARFHCNQGLLMMLFSIVTNACSALPALGWLISAVGWVMTMVMFVSGMYNVSKGRMKEMPIIGRIRLIWKG